MSATQRVMIDAIFTEQITAEIASAPTVPINHRLTKSISSRPVYRVWSRRVVVPTGPPIVFDMSALTNAALNITTDLKTGQDLRWASVDHVAGTGVGTVVFKNAADELQRLVLNPNAYHVSSVAQGKLFANVTDTIELTALTAELTVDVLLQTEQT